MTGATGAVGQAVSARWRQAGGRVLGVSRTAGAGGGDEGVVADLRSPWAAAGRVKAAVASRPVGALVHAAGVVYADQALRTTPDEWDQTLAVNLTAAFALARTLAPILTSPQGVVLVGSIDADFAPREGPDAAYGAAKAGLLGLARHLAVEWGPAGTRVNVVLPGPMTTGMGVSVAHAAAGAAGAADRRWTTAEEVAAAVMFLLTAGGVTGQALRVDHGWQLGY